MAESLAFNTRVGRAFILAQREARAAGHAALYPAHLLLGVAMEQPEHRYARPVLAVPIIWLRSHLSLSELPVSWKQQNQELTLRLRRLIQERYSQADAAPLVPALSDESKQVLRSACLAARAQQATIIAIHHLLLGLLDIQVADAHLTAAITPFISSLYESEKLGIKRQM